MTVAGKEQKKIVIGADHAGFKLKESLIKHLEDNGYLVTNVGCFNHEAVDYPHIASLLVRELQLGNQTQGILICGTGIGMSIAANRYDGIRAALCTNIKTAILSRKHNDANILVLGSRTGSEMENTTTLISWLDTPFEGGRHTQRLAMIGKQHDGSTGTSPGPSNRDAIKV